MIIINKCNNIKYNNITILKCKGYTRNDILSLDNIEYIYNENIPIVPLYLAEKRPVVNKGGQWIMIDDDRYPFDREDQVQMMHVRFRTLGCWPLTAAVVSEADSIEAVIAETLNARSSERQGRLIDSDVPGSMEKKKHEGYF
jgi:sulfate adenylyltransferase subunit 2